MIHFKCRCGRTLSADEDEFGDRLACPGCGEQVTVPVANAAGAVERPQERSGTHDFDAELVQAARRTPTRSLKRVTTTGERAVVPSAGGEEESRPRRPPRVTASGVLSALALVLLLGGAALFFLLIPAPLWARVLGSVGILAMGTLAFAVLRLLMAVNRRLAEIVEVQRDLARR